MQANRYDHSLLQKCAIIMLGMLFLLILNINQGNADNSIVNKSEDIDVYSLKKGVVSIYNNVIKSPYLRSGGYAGSGFVIDKKLGIIVTNSHVANNSSVNDIKVSFFNGKEIEATCLYADPWHDFSFLKVAPEELPEGSEALSFADYKPKAETKIIMIGNNQNQNYSIQEGSINSLYDNVGFFSNHSMIISMNVRGGASGSAVVDAKGKVLGIVFGGNDTFAYAIPMQYLRDSFEQLKMDITPKRQDIGAFLDFVSVDHLVRYDMLPKDIADQYLKEHPEYMNFAIGVKRSMIETPASKLLKPGDIIWSVNGVEIGADLYNMQKIMNHAKDSLKLIIYRDKVKKEVTIPLYDLHQSRVKRMLIFGGAVFYEADDLTRILDGTSLGNVVVKNVERGSAFDIFPVMDFNQYGSSISIKILSYKNQQINSLDDMIRVLPTLIKNKYFTIDYQNLGCYQGFSAVPVMARNIMNGWVDYQDYTEPVLLEYNEKTLAWDKKPL